MENIKKVSFNFRNPFFWLLASLPVLFFGLHWFFFFRLFSSDFSAGILFFILSLSGGSIFLLMMLFLEKERLLSVLIFCLGNVVPVLLFSLNKKASFLALVIVIGLALLFFSSGKKHFFKDVENQIKVRPVLSLKKPFRGLVFALGILFAFSFYVINFFQENYSQLATVEKEEIFGATLGKMVSVWEKLSPNGAAIGGFDLNLTIDEYIKQNLPDQDRSLLGSQVQLPDGTVTVFTPALLDDLEKTSLETAREQLSKQFEKSLKGNEKLFQVVGMILDQRVTGLVKSLEEAWPKLSPLLFVKSISSFFVFIWLGSLLRWPISKIVQGLLWLFFEKGLIKKEIRQIEKEELFFG